MVRRRTARRPLWARRWERGDFRPAGAPVAPRLPKSNAGQSNVERSRLGAPWVPARAAVAGTPGGSGWIPAPLERPGPPAFLLVEVRRSPFQYRIMRPRGAGRGMQARDSSTYGTHDTGRSVSQHRHHGAHRCREDDDDRAHPVLHGQGVQDRRGARRHGDDGLDGAGAGARHHDHVGRDDLLLEPARPEPRSGRRAGIPHQHHRHAGPRGFHGRSGALAARARRRGDAARFGGGRGAADGDGVAAGRPVQRAAA